MAIQKKTRKASAAKKTKRAPAPGKRHEPRARIAAPAVKLARAEKALKQARAALNTSAKGRMAALREANEYLEKEIAERQRAEEALRESEGRLQSLFDNMVEGVALHELVVDKGGRPSNYRIVAANPQYERILGLRREQVLGKLATEAYGTAAPLYLDEYARVALSGRADRIEVRSERMAKDFDVSVAPWGRNGFATLFTDITGRKRAEEDRAALEAQLRQAQKVEAIGQLAGGLAHEFNNMLFVINGHAGLLLNSPALHESLRNQLALILKTGERLAKLTAQILAFSRRQVLRLEVLNVNEVVNDTSRMLETLVGEQVAMKTVLDPALQPTRGDPTQLGQVLVSLVVNARDAMPSGGTLTVETANAELDEAYCRRRSGAKPGLYVMLAVSDTGCGMDENVKSHLFEPFFTTKDVGQGTGLGLASVHGIVKQSGGHVDVTSEVGKGTTFRVYLPQAEHGARRPGSSPRLPAPRGTETILVVDDEAEVCALVGALLESNGYSVVTATSGAEALEVCARHNDPVHLVIADVVMSGMSGPELVLNLHRQRPGIRVLFMSGYKAPVLSSQGLVRADEHFLQKPIKPDVLAQRVRNVLDERR